MSLKQDKETWEEEDVQRKLSLKVTHYNLS